jgi:sec-independent protein translocase protein TatA
MPGSPRGAADGVHMEMPQNLMMIGNPWQLMLVLVVVVLLFGKGKISDLMGDMAKGIKAFKKGMSDDDSQSAPAASPPKPLEHEPAARTGAGTHTEAGTKP